MADAKGQNEPSMEEILASIRQIISEDGKDEAGPEDDEAQPEEGHDVPPLDLTQVVNEDGSVTELTSSGPRRLQDFEAEHAAAEDFEHERAAIQDFEGDPIAVQDFGTEPEPESVPESEDLMLVEDPEHSEPPGVPAVEDVRIEAMAMDPAEPRTPEGLLSDAPAQTIGSALARLTGQTRLRRQADAATVEGLVQELLKPMLKEWLDENLPKMVERLVREEIERLTKRID